MLRRTLEVCLPLSALSFFLHFERKRKYSQNMILNAFLLLFALNSVISGLFSTNPRYSFYGTAGWGIGCFAIVSSTLTILLLSASEIDHCLFWRIFCPLLLFLSVLTVLHSCNIDVFHLHEIIRRTQYYDYVSTIGNTNWLTGLLCLVFPPLLLRFLNEEGQFDNVLYAVTLMLLEASVILCNSDAVFVGIGTFLLIGISSILNHREAYGKIALLLLSFAIELLLIRFLPVFAGKYATYDGLYLYLFDFKTILSIIVLAAVFYLIHIEQLKVSQKVISISIHVVRIFIVAVLIHFLFGLINSIRYYHYGWGNNRLKLWETTWSAYRYYFTSFNQIIGIGPEMQAYWYGYLNNELNTRFLVTHSEPLQILFTMGASGLLLYVMIVASMVYMAIKKRDVKLPNPYFYGLCSYVATSFFNSMNPVNLSIFTVIMALCLNHWKQEK